MLDQLLLRIGVDVAEADLHDRGVEHAHPGGPAILRLAVVEIVDHLLLLVILQGGEQLADQLLGGLRLFGGLGGTVSSQGGSAAQGHGAGRGEERPAVDRRRLGEVERFVAFGAVGSLDRRHSAVSL